jgi:glutamate synthase domain-containing protein 1
MDWRNFSERMHDECGVGFIANKNGVRSHDIVIKGVQAVSNLTHRGAVSGDAKTGDGSGILTRIPYKFFKRVFDSSLEEGSFAVAVVFLPTQEELNKKSREIITSVLKQRGIEMIGWRKVPVNVDYIGDDAKKSLPDIQQLFVKVSDTSKDTERKLYIARKHIESIFYKENLVDKCYFASFSSRTIVYKGLLIAPQLLNFFPDLQEEDFESDFVVFHQRYSTNT